ncbi:MAG: hypothetical protein M1377_01735 [Deltaproteobacteria bacterium]|nr:hypothetical protein [Deltaproteobacteria bacterium]
MFLFPREQEKEVRRPSPVKFLDKAEDGCYSVFTKLTKHSFFLLGRRFGEWDFEGEIVRERRWWLETFGGLLYIDGPGKKVEGRI